MWNTNEFVLCGMRIRRTKTGYTVDQEEFAKLRLDDPAYMSRRIRSAQYRAGDLAAQLQEFVPAAAEDVRALQDAERRRLAKALEERVMTHLRQLELTDGADLAGLRRRLDRVEQSGRRTRTRQRAGSSTRRAAATP